MEYYNKSDLIDYLHTIKYTKSHKIDYELGGTCYYLDIPCGFDIETTSTYINNTKFAFMYVGMFGIGKKVFYFRYWWEFSEILNTIRCYFMLSKNKRIVCYIHFMGFEFQFFRKKIKWQEVFAVDDRKPIKALSYYNIEFRDSYILSGLALEKTGDNLKNPIKKLVGNLDYNKIRVPTTKLTQSELNYCENDVKILLQYTKENIEDYGGIADIPLTNTGKVRKYVKENCIYSGFGKRKSQVKGSALRYRKLMEKLNLSLQEYLMCKLSFQGGFVHCNPYMQGKLLSGVNSQDLTSSYPYCMLSEKYPMSEPRFITDWEIIKDKNICSIFQIKIYNLKSKFDFDSYISESKVRGLTGAVINNGRIFSANYFETVITNVDFQIMQKVYDFDYEPIKGYWFYTQYLPKSLIDSILKLYEDKTILKGVEDKEKEYLKSKGMLNSVYGMCVTDIIRDLIEYKNDDWILTNKKEFTQDYMLKQIEKYDNKSERFLYYPWGVFVTAYARKNLWSAILALKDDYIYSDTDSVKYLNYDKHKEYFDYFNNLCNIKLKNMCDFRGIDLNRCYPKTKEGIIKPLGVWEYEGISDYFKSLGAKRYFTYNKKSGYKLTLSGLSKSNGKDYLIELGENNPEKVFEKFDNELTVSADKTGKNTHTYIDNRLEGFITDYNGNKERVIALSGVHLEKAEFTLSVTKQYINFINDLRKGYLYTGKKAI